MGGQVGSMIRTVRSNGRVSAFEELARRETMGSEGKEENWGEAGNLTVSGHELSESWMRGLPL